MVRELMSEPLSSAAHRPLSAVFLWWDYLAERDDAPHGSFRVPASVGGIK